MTNHRVTTVSGFWLLPEPAGTVVLLAAAVFVFVVSPPIVAASKGFGGWPWLVPSGLLGLAAVLLLPAANAPEITPDEHAARVRHGRWAGRVQAAVGGVAAVAAIFRSIAW